MNVSYCVIKYSNGEYDYIVCHDGYEKEVAENMGVELIEICRTRDAVLQSIDALTKGTSS